MRTSFFGGGVLKLPTSNFLPISRVALLVLHGHVHAELDELPHEGDEALLRRNEECRLPVHLEAVSKMF